MYIIINKTKNTTTIINGDFPSNYLDKLLNGGDDLIVISKYSNTIKVPTTASKDDFGDMSWDWKEYNLPKELL